MAGQELDEPLAHSARRAEDADFEFGFICHEFPPSRLDAWIH
jgi:hypothetical protein